MIPNKSNFKFQELTPITGVKPYVLRYWETEFEEISPVTSDSGLKLYARKDVEAILKIKKLLFEEKLSIPEARLKIQNRHEQEIIESIKEESEQLRLKNGLEQALLLIEQIKIKNNWP